MIRTGIIGLSEGNGHPFSFSAIINGYDDQGFAESGWPVIHDYLRLQSPDAFGFPGVRVTHAWTQDPETTKRLCAACRIDKPVADPGEMLGEIDALIIARDDWNTHAPLALPALERGLKVFVDKPLTLDMEELALFQPYLESGQLMSTSGMRYAHELDPLRAEPESLGRFILVQGTVLNGLDRYGVHMIDAILGLGMGLPVSITRLAAAHESYALSLADGALFQLNCLGNVGKTFHLSIFGQNGHFHADLHNNFGAFQRTLAAFFRMVETGAPPFPPVQVIRVMEVLTAANRLALGQTWRHKK